MDRRRGGASRDVPKAAVEQEQPPPAVVREAFSGRVLVSPEEPAVLVRPAAAGVHLGVAGAAEQDEVRDRVVAVPTQLAMVHRCPGCAAELAPSVCSST